MQIEIPKETGKELEEAADILGIEKDEVLKKALHHYAEEIKKMAALKKEMNAWDKLSDEAFEKFERELWKMEKSG